MSTIYIRHPQHGIIWYRKCSVAQEPYVPNLLNKEPVGTHKCYAYRSYQINQNTCRAVPNQDQRAPAVLWLKSGASWFYNYSVAHLQVFMKLLLGKYAGLLFFVCQSPPYLILINTLLRRACK